jgi:hypothetical protein
MPGEDHLFTKRREIWRYGRTSSAIDRCRHEVVFDRWLVFTFSFEEGSTRVFDSKEPAASDRWILGHEIG